MKKNEKIKGHGFSKFILYIINTIRSGLCQVFVGNSFRFRISCEKVYSHGSPFHSGPRRTEVHRTSCAVLTI